MRHDNNSSNNNNNNNNNNNRRLSSLLVAALSVAAASTSYPCHDPRQPAAAVETHTAVAAVVVAIAVSVSNDGDGNDNVNDDKHAGCLTEGLAAPPVRRAGVTARLDKHQRLAKSTGSAVRVTKPVVGRETRVKNPTMSSDIRATKPILASALRATTPMGSSCRSSRRRCGVGRRPARVARGGSTEHGRLLLPRRALRTRRPLRRFLAPALVWVFAVVVDYDLWWKLESGTAAPASDGAASTLPFGSMIAGRFAKAMAAKRAHFVCFHVLLVLALLSHVAVTFADPGFCPPPEAPFLVGEEAQQFGRWCDHCHAAKPPRAHHCRRCGGCVARMDHHCIYAANCVGAGNHKQFILLLLYSASCAAHANLLYFWVLGRGRFDDSAKNALNSVAGASAAAAAAAAVTTAQYSASDWQAASMSSSLSPSLLSSSAGGGGGADPRGWRGVVSVVRRLLLPVLAVVALFWLVALLSVHLYGVAVDAGTVDRMQAASSSRGAEEAAAAAPAPVATGSIGERGRRLLTYRGRAGPAPTGLSAPSGGLLGFLEGELGAGAALRSTAGNSSRSSSSNSGGAGAAMPSAARESARSAAICLARRREGGFEGVTDSPRGPLGRTAATATVAAAGAGADAESDGEKCAGKSKEVATLCSVFCGRWKTLREEVLGDGPWVMWFVPSPAKLAPEVRERVFAYPQDRKGDMRFCSPAR